MKKSTLVITAVALIIGGIGGGFIIHQYLRTPPATKTGPSPITAPTPALSASTVQVSEKDKDSTLRVENGTVIDLVLSSTYWKIQPAAGVVLKPILPEPIVTGVLSHPPGMGTGTVEMKYQVVQDGTATISASRTTCGEALRCTGTQGEFMVTIVAGASGSAAAAPSTVLVSDEDTTKYCNGTVMDSDGYRKTIIKIQPFVPAPASVSQADRLRAVLAASTTGMCKTIITGLDVTVNDGAAHIPPIDGWAGVSITMCSCKPQVEVNLLRQPGITSVVWE